MKEYKEGSNKQGINFHNSRIKQIINPNIKQKNKLRKLKIIKNKK